MVDLNNAIKNAIERGGNLEEVKQSFLNAGYTQEEIEKASYLANNQSVVQSQPYPKSASQIITEPVKKLENYQIKPAEKANSTLVIILVILSVLVAIGGVSFVLFSLLK